MARVLLCRAESIAPWLLSVAHPYAVGIGLTGAALAWFALEASAAFPRRAIVGVALSFLACWLSPLSLPTLTLASVPLALAQRDAGRWRFLGRVLAQIAAGFTLERLAHGIYLRYVDATYGALLSGTFRVETSAEIAITSAPDAVRRLLAVAGGHTSREEELVFVCALVIVAVLTMRHHVGANAGFRSPALVPILLACAGAAIGNFIGVAFSDWTRLNEYPFRYLVPTIAWSIVAATLSMSHVLTVMAERVRVPSMALVTGTAVATAIWILSARPDSGTLRDLESTARGLATVERPAVVFGAYGDVYVWQALNSSLLAVPLEGQWTRTPDTRSAAASYSTAWLCASDSTPPAELRQFQGRWRRTPRPTVESPRCLLVEYGRLEDDGR